MVLDLPEQLCEYEKCLLPSNPIGAADGFIA